MKKRWKHKINFIAFKEMKSRFFKKSDIIPRMNVVGSTERGFAF